jgi:hypothetical protein
LRNAVGREVWIAETDKLAHGTMDRKFYPFRVIKSGSAGKVMHGFGLRVPVLKLHRPNTNTRFPLAGGGADANPLRVFPLLSFPEEARAVGRVLLRSVAPAFTELVRAVWTKHYTFVAERDVICEEPLNVFFILSKVGKNTLHKLTSAKKLCVAVGEINVIVYRVKYMKLHPPRVLRRLLAVHGHGSIDATEFPTVNVQLTIEDEVAEVEGLEFFA